jgi:small subunit ribosomal protein S1
MSDEKNLEIDEPQEEMDAQLDHTSEEEDGDVIIMVQADDDLPKVEEEVIVEEDEDEDDGLTSILEGSNASPYDTPHDEFDWSKGAKNKLAYTSEEIARYTSDYEKSLTTLDENIIVKGKVTSFSSGDVVLDINYKSDGLVSASEFRDMPDLKIGDIVAVYVEATEDDKGQLILSRRKAKLFQAWENIVDSYNNGTIIKGTIVSKTKGGLIADCSGLETFLPGSQIDIKPIIDYDAYVGKTMEFKVVKINEAIKNAVVSHKALIESDLAEQREQIIGGLEKGQVLEGVVKNITDFGAFMDLGGVDGLLYITDISWGRINHPNEVLALNQKINVVVLDFDENKKRISLGLKQLQPHPWNVLDANIGEGSTVKGTIVNIEDYGAFLEIIPGVEGLIHVSEVNWSTQPVNAREFFTLGQEFESKVVTLDREERKMSLSIKQLTEDPWGKIVEIFPVGSEHEGEVKNLTPYGVFVELEEGIGGMIHISDLSWTKRFNHPSEYTRVGEKIKISILEIDINDRKLALGHKQLEENPWDTFENVFPVGSYHDVTVIKKDDRGAIVQLPYGLEAYAPIKHLRKDENSTANVEDNLTVKVIEFNRDDKRIVVSHSRYLEDIRRKADDEVKKMRSDQEVETRQAIKQRSNKMEKTTLGELDVFSQLKDQLKAQEEKKAAKASTSKAAKAATAKVSSSKGDDLKKIEGIGPKIAELLSGAGIATFSALAETEAEKIKEILAEGGSRYQMHDPTSWPEQAALAADGSWDDLKKLQEELNGGKK